jgi:serine/threonine protein kinase
MSDTQPTIAQFLETVDKSGLLDAARIAEATLAWPDRSLPLPDELVQALIDAELLTKWQTDQLRKGRHKGFVLGKYRLLRLLGAGGMSSVYLGEHTTLHSKAAIKVLPIKRVDQSSYLARFEREAQASARLSHPNIVRAFDLDTSGSIHFIAMEYVDGIDLHAKVKQDGPLPLRQAVDFIRQAALGLQHAHEEGLVHRDIKPANLILDGRGTVKILDLGLAFAKGEDDASLTQEHGEKVLGTADYLSPEQAKDSHKADARSDIYSLGCTFHYLLTGRPPFAKGTLAERIQAHLRTPPPNLLDERSDTPPALVELFFRMMEKHPDARPQEARDVAATLAAWLAANEATGPQGRAEPPRRAPPRRSPGSGVAAGRGPGGSGIAAASRASSNAPRTPGGSGVGGSGPLAMPPPQPVRKAGSASPRSGPVSGIHLDTGGGTHAAKPAAGHAHPQKPAFAPLGVPLAAWIAVAAGLLLAAYLGWQVMSGSAKKGKSKKNDEKSAAAAKATNDVVKADDVAGKDVKADHSKDKPKPPPADDDGPLAEALKTPSAGPTAEAEAKGGEEAKPEVTP